ncbi:hypothetical protein FRC17_004736 [Serendipita sp. 399]|nr:hypothetical protein FRC17_004736 [Serendipita sp. 399]
MHVCRAWRLAALTTPALWTRIKLMVVDRKDRQKKTCLRVSEGYEVCSTPNQLSRALQRVGSVPLDLWIFVSEFSWRTAYQGAYDTARVDVMSLVDLMKKQLLQPRLRSLRIQNPSGFQLGDWFDDFTFRDLKSFDVDRSYPNLFKKVAKEVGNLQALTAPAPDVLSLKPKLSHIEELGLLRSYGVAHESVEAFLDSSDSLTALTLQGSIIGSNSKTALPGLRRLNLWDVPNAWPIESANLTHLTIRAYTEHTIQHIYLPDLVHLSYTGDSGKFLGSFEVPALYTLELTIDGRKSDTARGTRSVWINNPNHMINPVVFKLFGTKINSKHLAKVLEAMTNCEEFYSKKTMIHADLFSSLVPEKNIDKLKAKKKPSVTRDSKPKGTWRVPAPKLRIIVGDMSGCRAKLDESELWVAARNFVAARESASIPLDELSLRLDGGGWKDFVTDDLEDRDI